MQKIAGMLLMFAGMSAVAMAAVTTVPEIDSSAAVSALVVIAGAVLVIRGRRKTNKQ